MVCLDAPETAAYEAIRRGASFTTLVENLRTAVLVKRQAGWHLPLLAVQQVIMITNRSATAPLCGQRPSPHFRLPELHACGSSSSGR